MEQKGNMAQVSPVKLGPNSRFKFSCHKEVPCFTQCCRGINIILTPYDIIRLKKRLDLTSEAFLAIYTQPQLLEKTDLPVVTLKLLDDDLESCPFVKNEGCLVYEDRPTSCRYYPLGVATLQHKEGAEDEGFFFFVNEPHCRGFEEEKEWTVNEWRKDQGVDIHDEINAAWMDLVVRKRSFPPNIKLTEKAKEMFFMVSYNIDKFRQFVFDSTFLKRIPVDADTRKKIQSDDVALFEFGVEWLASILFPQKGMQDTPAPDTPESS